MTGLCFQLILIMMEFYFLPSLHEVDKNTGPLNTDFIYSKNQSVITNEIVDSVFKIDRPMILDPHTPDTAIRDAGVSISNSAGIITSLPTMSVLRSETQDVNGERNISQGNVIQDASNTTVIFTPSPSGGSEASVAPVVSDVLVSPVVVETLVPPVVVNMPVPPVVVETHVVVETSVPPVVEETSVPPVVVETHVVVETPVPPVMEETSVPPVVVGNETLQGNASRNVLSIADGSGDGRLATPNEPTISTMKVVVQRSVTHEDTVATTTSTTTPVATTHQPIVPTKGDGRICLLLRRQRLPLPSSCLDPSIPIWN